jgi:hypothetical protein
MTDNVENLLIEHMRAMRATLEKLERNDEEFKLHFAAIEAHIRAIHLDNFHDRSALAELDHRVTRLERRMELRDAP